MSRTDETTAGDSRVTAVPEELLQSGLPPRPFWQRFLQWGHGVLAAEAGVLWELPPDSGRLTPQGMFGNPHLRQPILQRDDGQVSHVLQAAATDETVVRQSLDRDDDPLAQRLLIAVPVHSADELFGVLEFILPAEVHEDEIEAPLRVFLGGLQLVGQQAGSHADEGPETALEFWQEFEAFSYSLHRSLVITDVADVAVNDGRKLLSCDRLSITARRGRSNRIIAVSGQEMVNRRSREVRSLEQIAAESVAAGEILEFRADRSDLPPHLIDTFSRYIEISSARLVQAIPLYAPVAPQPSDETDPRKKPGRRAVGCLLIEQFARSRLNPERASRVPRIADTIGAALANAISHEQILFLPTRRRLGKGLEFFRGRTLAKTLAVLTLLAATVLVMILVPYEYRVEASGRLMPKDQRPVFAPWDGVVVSVNVASGQRVAAGDELLMIYNDELHEQLVTARNELLEKRQQVLALGSEIAATARMAGRRDTEIQLKGQQQELRLEIEGLQERIALLEQREDSLRLTAPIDGVVATFRVEEQLRDRPVTRGDQLLEVMADQSDWVLELELPEHRMGHLLRAAEAAESPKLPVEYVLATDVGTSFPGQLAPTEIASRSDVGEESETVVRMLVDIDPTRHPVLRIGGETTAKVDCGRKPLGYVLFGDVWEFLIRHLWI